MSLKPELKDRVYEIQSIVDDIVYDAERGKINWEDALIEMRYEIEQDKTYEERDFFRITQADVIRQLDKEELLKALDESEIQKTLLKVKHDFTINWKDEILKAFYK